MASSLRRQVDALRHASSGTSSGYIQRKKGKPSLLLTPDQAADVDLSSVRETAVMGLERLEAVDHNFSAFKGTLFSKEAQGTLRDLQTKESNERIDKSISAFLALLSPHFSSREAHLCLEYLIRHYKVYQYNVDAVVECCLPWHDTLAFARMVQLLSLKGSRWEFLSPVQTSGCPLPREAIARRCAHDFGLLRFLCVSARSSAARAASSSTASSSTSAVTAAGRSKLFSFYAAVVVEALASLGSASESLLRALVPTVVHGLSATEAPEYQMASYMILSALSGKGPLSPEVTSTAMTALVCKPCRGGLEASLLCALAVAQTQVGFRSRKGSPSSGPPPFLPTPAFEALSRMESLADVLAGLAKKFDATAFLWLLLQSYVHHLTDDEGGAHGKSLVRLCTYAFWPSHSLPKLVRRLVDRIIRSYLAMALDEFDEGDKMAVEGQAKPNGRAAAMKEQGQMVLRVLGQRFPREVDAAVGKISRGMAKVKAAAVQDRTEEVDEDEVDDSQDAKRKSVRREELLSSLLLSSFAGVELAQRLPLDHQENNDAPGCKDAVDDVVHGSLMVALEHTSSTVRAQAVEQLSRVMSTAAVENVGEDHSTAPAATGVEELAPSLIRRLHDEDPEVVLAVTDSDVLVRKVLLPSTLDTADGDVNAPGASDNKVYASAVANAAATAAIQWLSLIVAPRPKFPVARSGKVLCGLVRLMADAAAATYAEAFASEEESKRAKEARDSALCLLIECLPGPQAVARARAAQQQASAVASSGSVVVSEGHPAGASSTTSGVKACKKALRAVGRAAIEALDDFCRATEGAGITSLFAGLKMIVKGEQEEKTEELTAKKSRRTKADEDDSMEVESQVKSKGLKAMGDGVCQAIAIALVEASGKESVLKEVKGLPGMSRPGFRWLVMESLSRAVHLASASSSGDTHQAGDVSVFAPSRLAALLASISILELCARPTALSVDRGDVGSCCMVKAHCLMQYLQVCTAHLPKVERPLSLVAEDHLTAASRVPEAADGPMLVEVLVSILRAAPAIPDAAESEAVWEAVSSVLLNGYARRPLSALAAVIIDGVSSMSFAGKLDGTSRGDRRTIGDEDDGKVLPAARALCVASTFVRAAAEARTSGDGVFSAEMQGDLVLVFPAALMAVASNHKCLQEGGALLISSIDAHGDVLLGGPVTGTTTRSAKKSIATPKGQGVVENDSVFLPMREEQQGGVPVPPPLHAPSFANLLKLARGLSDRNREATLDAQELSRYLASFFVGEVGNAEYGLIRYLVAWSTRLGWRNPTGSALLLECLVWAIQPMRECCLPLLHHRLDEEDSGSNTENDRLLKLLLDVTVSFSSTAKETIEQDSKHKTTNDKSSAVSGGSTNAIFPSREAENLMHRALRMSRRVQAIALRSLTTLSASATSCASDVGSMSTADECIRQRRDLLLGLVETSISGADTEHVAAAARAIQVQPSDIASLMSALVPVASSRTPSKVRKKPSAASPSGDSTHRTVWVLKLGGLVELAQVLCGAFSSSLDQPTHKGRGSDQGRVVGAQGWDWSAPFALARPLFDSLPGLLGVATKSELAGGATQADTLDAAEYALWLTMDVLGIVLRRWGKHETHGGEGSSDAKGLYDCSHAGKDSENVLACVRGNPSPQTRGSALALLSKMAALFPAQMASQLGALLDMVCAAATSTEGLSGPGSGSGARATLRQTQKAVESVVPALKTHGADAGVGAHSVVQVFVDALEDAPVHSRRALFSTLVDSLGDESRPIMSALLLKGAVLSASRAPAESRLVDDEGRIALIEFVHQMMHCSGAQAQVRTLVGLVKACHRLSVNTAKRSGDLSERSFEDAIKYYCQEYDLDNKTRDYMKLPLDHSARTGKNAFMTMDLEAVSKDVSTESMGKFLLEVLTFTRDHLASRPLVMAVATAAEYSSNGGGEDEEIQKGFLLLCEELLLLLRTVATCDRPSGSDSDGGFSGPFWSQLQSLSYEVLETVQSLLSVPSFVAVTQELLHHEDPHLRRKSLQMFTRRLDPEGGSGRILRLTPGEESLFVDMLSSLRSIAMGKKATGASLPPEEDSSGEDLEEVMGPSSDYMNEDKCENGMKESAINRQTALLSLDVLARVLGKRHQSAFDGVLDDVTEIIAGTGPSSLPAVDKPGSDGILPLRASAFLLVATLCAVLGVRAFPRLPRFFPAMLEALESSPVKTLSGGGGQNLLWTSALSAVATVAASLPSFLSPYLGRILAVSLRPASASSGKKQAADRVLSLLAGGVEARLLVPSVCGAYPGCVKCAKDEHETQVESAAKCVARLLAFVQEIVAGLEKEATSAALPHLTRLMTQALDFRRQHAFGSSTPARRSAELVETEASSALVSIVMKLSEVELRPLFLHLCEWKAGISGEGSDVEATLGPLDRRLSFYRVLDGLAGTLKSIFTPYFAHVLTDCCDDLEAASTLATIPVDGLFTAKKRKREEKEDKDDAGNRRKRRKTLSPDDQEDEVTVLDDAREELRWRRMAAARLVLSALRRCFQLDRSGFINKARFDMLMPAVVAQLECGSSAFVETEESDEGTQGQQVVASYRLHAEELVGPCLAQLAMASGKDVLWKAMANSVLMKTRSKKAGVRVAAIVSLRQCFQVIGEEFLALLPECLPFLSELLEDGHPEVENECRALVKYIEGVLGESIESFLV